MGHLDPIAYSYDADTHCPDCARERFGANEHGHVYGEDSEGNPVGIVSPWDEVDVSCGIYCGTCGEEIVESQPFTVVENTPGYLPDDDDPATFHDRRDALRYMIERMRQYRDDMRDNGESIVGWINRDAGEGYLWNEGRPHDIGRAFAVVDTPAL